MSKMVSLTCAGCSTVFERKLAEVKRQRRGRADYPFFCSRRCYSVSQGSRNLGEHLGSGRTDQLDPANQLDRWSPFRYFMRKARNRKHTADIDLPYLEELWQSQEGRCALSGLLMEMPGTGQAWEKKFRDPFKPSLDRIDNRLGYVKGNVRFVCVIANMAKGAFSDEDLVTFCTAVAALHAPPLASEPQPPAYRFTGSLLAA